MKISDSLLFFIASLAVGFSVGWTQPQSPQSRSLASQTDGLVLEYESLKCPTQEQFLLDMAELNIVLPETLQNTADPCDNDLTGRLSKLLTIVKKLTWKIPSALSGKVVHDLQSLPEFLKRNYKTVEISAFQFDSVANNQPSLKKITLHPYFFELPILEAIGTLFHEARHSEESDPGHEICNAGDVPSTPGGCDRVLSREESKAGGYSYDFFYSAYSALYLQNIGDKYRRLLTDEAFYLVGARFNETDSAIAHRVSVLAGLRDDGEVQILSPFFPDPITIGEPKELFRKEKISRIESHINKGGILAFTNQGRIFIWTFPKKWELFLPEQLEDQKWKDAARIRIPFGDYPYYSFVSQENELVYSKYDEEKKRRILEPYYIFYSKEYETPQFHRMTLAYDDEVAFLSADHRVFLGAQFGSQKPFREIKAVRSPDDEWIQIHSGATYSSMFLTNKEGNLYEVLRKIEYVGDDDEIAHYSLKPIPFGKREVRKYLEGNQNSYVLSTGRDIIRWPHGTDDREVIFESRNWVDFTLLRSQWFDPSIPRPSQHQNTKGSRCGLKQEVIDPWTQAKIGLDKNGRLILDDGRFCIVSELREKVDSIDFRKPSASENEVHLELNIRGEKQIWRPYESRPRVSPKQQF